MLTSKKVILRFAKRHLRTVSPSIHKTNFQFVGRALARTNESFPYSSQNHRQLSHRQHNVYYYLHASLTRDKPVNLDKYTYIISRFTCFPTTKAGGVRSRTVVFKLVFGRKAFMVPTVWLLKKMTFCIYAKSNLLKMKV